MLANLPAGEPDPLRRLSLIRQQMGNLKDTHQAVGAEALAGMLGFAAPPWLALGTRAAFRTRQPLVQTVTTTVPGPRSVAILSYVDTVSFGVTADVGCAADLDVFTAGIQHGLAELSG